MGELFKVEFIGYKGRDVVSMMLYENVSTEDYQAYFTGDPKKYILENHPNGANLDIERAFSVLSLNK